MCGIAGMVSWDGGANAASVAAMCAAMVHRGPDDQGIYDGDEAVLGMRRLSIIDLATGHQPVSNEDGTVWVVFNGEIYNFKELRRDLLARGHRFATATDTETIVHLYEEYGTDAVRHLRGMFAFAIWDAPQRRLFIARDRLGIKPLFYTQVPGGLAFASEVKCLLQLPEVSRRLSWSALAHVFTFLATPATESIVAGIRKLDAGHQMVVGPSGRIDVRRYWDLRFDPRTDASEVQLAEELGALLEESVNLHLCSDVPLGAFLSGGLDSSAVVGLMSRLTPGRVKTFSIGFEDPRYDERPHARLAAETFGTEHHELVVSPHALDVIDDIVWHLDEPFGDSSAIPTYMVSELASEHVKVVLTGDGGDEIFGGYDKYVVEQREREVDRVPSWLRRPLGLVGDRMPIGMTGRRFLRHFALAGGRRYLDASTLFTRRDQASLFQPDVAAEIRDADPLGPALDALSRGLPPLSALQYCDVRGYLPLDILVKVDRMTMAHSIEARPPLLDHRLVEFAARIPATMQIRGGTTKFLFKQAVRPFVPPSTIDRPKQGFAVPLGAWFRGPWTGFAKDVLLSSTCRRRGIFAPAYLERLLRVNDQGRNMDRELWTLVSFELWCRAFLDGAPVERARPLLEAARPA